MQMPSNQIKNFSNRKSATILFAKKLTINSRRKIIFNILIPLALILGGCGNRDDLERIQKFTALANKAAEGFPTIANDFYLSCLRSAHYRAFLPTRQVNPVVTRIEVEKDCNEKLQLQDLGTSLIEANEVLVDYVSSLGKLATDDIIDYSTDIKGLEGELSKLPKINKSQVEGGINIATILLRAAKDGYRREKLKEVIVSTDDDLQIFIEGIKTIMNEAYIGIYLRNEESVINGYYGDYITNLVNNRAEGDTQSLTILLLDLDNRWATNKDEVEQKRNFARDYIGILDSIAQNHGALRRMFANGKSPSSKEMKKMLDKNTKNLESFVKKLKDVQSK